MSFIMAGVAVVGTGLNVYGDIESSNAQAQIEQERANEAQQQADVIQQREVANEALRQATAAKQELQYGSASAATGHEGVAIGSQLEIQKQSDLQSGISNEEAQFQEQMLMTQAGIDTSMAGSDLEGGELKAIGAGVSGLAGAANSSGAFTSPGGTQSLGAFPSADASNNFGASQLTMPQLGSSAGYAAGASPAL